MTHNSKQPISPFLTSTKASAFILGAFIFGLVALCVVLFGTANWQVNAQNLPNIMPVLMAIISFFAVGYSIMCVVTSRFFQSLAFKRPNYSHLEF